jgi:hypothetical protein
MQTATGRHAIDPEQVLEEDHDSFQGSRQGSQRQSSDALLLYPHVVNIVRRIISNQGMDRPAASRMDASIILEKFLAANAGALTWVDVPGSLAGDLDLAEGSDEAEALLGLSRFRGRKDALQSVSWRSFVHVFPKLRASGFHDLSALSEVLEL